MSIARGTRNNVRAGTLVIAAIVLALAVVIYIGGAFERFGKRSYFIEFTLEQGVPGLAQGSPVRVGGQDVGQVTAVTFETPSAGTDNAPLLNRVRIALSPDITLREGAVAVLERPLLGSSSIINFPDLGRESGAVLPPGSIIRGQGAPGLLAQAGLGPEQIERLRGILDDSKQITSKVNRALDNYESVVQPNLNDIFSDTRAVVGDVRKRSPQWFDRVDATTLSVAELTGELRQSVPGVVKNLDGRMAQVKGLLDAVQTIVDENRGDLRSTMSAVASVTQKANEKTIELVNGLLTSAQSRLNESGDTLQAILEKGNLVLTEQTPVIRESMAEFRIAASQLGAMMGEVRASPWRLLYRPDKRETEFEQLYESARAYADAVTDLRTVTEALAALSEAADQGALPGVNDPEQRELINGLLGALGESRERYAEAEKQFLDMIIEKTAE